jgi:predicted Rossmann fold nucleotide-binding protein DprA/Smf involved in DNA uptake
MANDFSRAIEMVLGEKSPDWLAYYGDLGLLKSELLALFCSVKCPGSLILQAYDVSVDLCQAGISVIAGFHSPVEKDALTILLRGIQPIVICYARGLAGIRIPREYKKPLADGRLLLISVFDEKQKRPTQPTALLRNRLVAALASKILFIHAEEGGKLERLCKQSIEWGKKVYTLSDPSNSNLVEMGAVELHRISITNVSEVLCT